LAVRELKKISVTEFVRPGKSEVRAEPSRRMLSTSSGMPSGSAGEGKAVGAGEAGVAKPPHGPDGFAVGETQFSAQPVGLASGKVAVWLGVEEAGVGVTPGSGVGPAQASSSRIANTPHNPTDTHRLFALSFDAPIFWPRQIIAPVKIIAYRPADPAGGWYPKSTRFPGFPNLLGPPTVMRDDHFDLFSLSRTDDDVRIGGIKIG
jgi:hypothetical protein